MTIFEALSHSLSLFLWWPTTCDRKGVSSALAVATGAPMIGTPPHLLCEAPAI